MMLALTEKEFIEKLEQFKELEKNNEKNLLYLQDNWLNCIEKWARFKRTGMRLNIQETNNPVEDVNHQVKQFSEDQHAKNSLAQCLTSTLKYVKSTELNKIVLANYQKNKIIQIQNVSTNSIINEFYKVVAPNMASWLRDQYEKSKSTPYALELSSLVGEGYVKINDKSYLLKDYHLDSAVCSCYHNQSLGLPCRHLFFAKENQNLPAFNMNMVPDTHKINLSLIEVEDRVINLVSSVPDLTSIRSLVTSKNMTQKSKWDAAWRISQEFANCLKYKKQKDFEISLAKLMQSTFTK
jgi:hypothetical protein